jgi:hypothetical protein
LEGQARALKDRQHANGDWLSALRTPDSSPSSITISLDSSQLMMPVFRITECKPSQASSPMHTGAAGGCLSRGKRWLREDRQLYSRMRSVLQRVADGVRHYRTAITSSESNSPMPSSMIRCKYVDSPSVGLSVRYLNLITFLNNRFTVYSGMQQSWCMDTGSA